LTAWAAAGRALQGIVPTPVPADPLIYRWYGIVSVYGTTIEERVHKEFGGGIMSAMDFSMDMVCQPDPRRAAASAWCCQAIVLVVSASCQSIWVFLIIRAPDPDPLSSGRGAAEGKIRA
jgi:Cyanate lyase C-terminal domain